MKVELTDEEVKKIGVIRWRKTLPKVDRWDLAAYTSGVLALLAVLLTGNWAIRTPILILWIVANGADFYIFGRHKKQAGLAFLLKCRDEAKS